MKRISLLWVALLVALPISVTLGQTNPVGIQTGVVLEDGYKGALAYGVVTEIGVSGVPVVGAIVSKVEASYLYSDRSWGNQAELNVTRLFSVRQFHLSTCFYLGLGGGIWHVIDTEGGDSDYFAFRGEAGCRIKLVSNLELYAGFDICRRRGPDLFFPHLSISLL